MQDAPKLLEPYRAPTDIEEVLLDVVRVIEHYLANLVSQLHRGQVLHRSCTHLVPVKDLILTLDEPLIAPLLMVVAT